MQTELAGGGTCDHQVAREESRAVRIEDCGQPAVVVLVSKYYRRTRLCRDHAEDLMSRLQEIIAVDD